MRIGIIAPIVERVPPKKYGGTERVVHALTEELVQRGHQVTLFASGDSITNAKLVSVFPRALRETNIKDLYGANHYTLLNVGAAFDRQAEFDVIHDHVGPLALPTANLATTPTICTMHGPFTPEVRKLLRTLRKPGITTISDSQYFASADINHVGTVYNGLHMEHYAFSDKPGDYLLFVGRICLEKGTHFAIQVAQELDIPLIIAAKVDSVDRGYFESYVHPWLSDRIQWIGEVDEEKRNELMAGARCFLHPVTWREPFGLTLIEAQACGAPVVAFAKGSIPEIVEHGKTGFVVEDIEEMVDAVDKIHEIDRNECRARALNMFSAKKMTDGYEEAYQRILAQ
jgi:glycosyltransferase involved in cell wall biosynthesis